MSSARPSVQAAKAQRKAGASRATPIPADALLSSSFDAELTAAYHGQPVLITGGMGFIGSNLGIRLVGLGAQVTIVDAMLPAFGGNAFNLSSVEERVRVHFSDVRDQHALHQLVQGQRFLFNLAAQTSHLGSVADPLTDLDINARGQLLLLEACRNQNPAIQIVHASSRHVYGRVQRLPVDETHPVAPLDMYSVSKLAGEQYHRLYGTMHRLRVRVLRLTNTYGPRQNALDFIGVFMRRAVLGQPLQVYGDGAQVRDYAYVADVCDALLLAGAREHTIGNVYNLGGASHCSVRAFAEQLAAIAGVSVETVPFPAERASIEIGHFYADDRRFRAATGWAPRVPLEKGLQATYDYFAAHRTHYVR